MVPLGKLERGGNESKQHALIVDGNRAQNLDWNLAFAWLWLSKPFWDPILGKANSPPILEPILVVGLGCYWGYGLWLLTHGHLSPAPVVLTSRRGTFPKGRRKRTSTWNCSPGTGESFYRACAWFACFAWGATQKSQARLDKVTPNPGADQTSP